MPSDLSIKFQVALQIKIRYLGVLKSVLLHFGQLFLLTKMSGGIYENTTSCYSIIQELLKCLAKFGFSDLLGFWHDILLPQLVCGHVKG